MKEISFALVIAAIFDLLAIQGHAWQNTKPLTETDLIDLLKNEVSPERVGEMATQKGIDFELTPDAEKALWQAGANAALVSTLRSLTPKIAPPKSPAPTRQPESPPKPGVTLTPQPEPTAKPKVGSIRINPKDGQRYVWITPGGFMMGCSPGESECFVDEKPPHQVKLTKGFWLGQTAVTVGAWKRYRSATGADALPTADSVGRKNWNEAGDENMPAVMMTWNEAKSYCEWASLRLPTEAEWEYAARAGTTAARHGDLDSIAWYGDNSGTRKIDSRAIYNEDSKTYAKKLYENGNFVHGVGLKEPNAWKLYDMLGNVIAWTADWYDAGYYAKSETDDPMGAPAGEFRVARGGSWDVNPLSVRFSLRDGYVPGLRMNYVGCRCAGDLP